MHGGAARWQQIGQARSRPAAPPPPRACAMQATKLPSAASAWRRAGACLYARQAREPPRATRRAASGEAACQLAAGLPAARAVHHEQAVGKKTSASRGRWRGNGRGRRSSSSSRRRPTRLHSAVGLLEHCQVCKHLSLWREGREGKGGGVSSSLRPRGCSLRAQQACVWAPTQPLGAPTLSSCSMQASQQGRRAQEKESHPIASRPLPLRCPHLYRAIRLLNKDAWDYVKEREREK